MKNKQWILAQQIVDTAGIPNWRIVNNTTGQLVVCGSVFGHKWAEMVGVIGKDSSVIEITANVVEGDNRTEVFRLSTVPNLLQQTIESAWFALGSRRCTT